MPSTTTPATRRAFLAGGASLVVGGTASDAVRATETAPTALAPSPQRGGRFGAGSPTPATGTARPPAVAWSRTYSPGDAGTGLVRDVVDAGDGFVLPGVTGGDGYRAWVAGVDGVGRLQWQRRLPVDGSAFFAGAPAPDGGALLAGRTNGGTRPDRPETGDPVLARVTAAGEFAWVRTYQPDAGDGRATGLVRAGDGYVLVGGVRVDDRERPWAAAVDGRGTVRWRWRGTDPSRQGAAQAAAATGGGVVVAGSDKPASAEGYGRSEDAWVAKLGPDGDRTWHRRFSGDLGERVETLAPRTGGGVVAAGKRGFSGEEDGDPWLVALDAAGETEWERTYPQSRWNWVHDVARVADGYVFVGTREVDADPDTTLRGAWAVRVGPDGRPQWTRSYDGDGAGTEGWTVRPVASGGLLVGGSVDRGEHSSGWLLNAGGDRPSGGSGLGSPSLPSVPSWAGPLAVGAGVGAALAGAASRLRDSE